MKSNIASNAVIIGVIASLTASFITLLISFLYNKFWYWIKYHGLKGTYKGYGYKDEMPEWKLKEKPQSEAHISHLGKNKLSIGVSDLNKSDRYSWSGKIYMDSENHGSVSWKYEKYAGKKFGDNKHKYGFKNAVFIKDENNTYLYLNPEPGDGFGKEVFIKNS